MVRRFYKFGPFVLDPISSILLHNQQRVLLTPKMFDALLVLVQSGRRVLGKREFIGTLWPNTFVEENNLTQNICRLRQALARISSQTYIETIPKRGYRFTARVKEFWDHGDGSEPGRLEGQPAIVALGERDAEKRKMIKSVNDVDLIDRRSRSRRSSRTGLA